MFQKPKRNCETRLGMSVQTSLETFKYLKRDKERERESEAERKKKETVPVKRILSSCNAEVGGTIKKRKTTRRTAIEQVEKTQT